MWVKAAEFAVNFKVEYEALKKACVRAFRADKNFCKVKCNILRFSYTHGKGGKSGRVLMIWDEAFESEGEAAEFALRGKGVDFSPVAQNDKVGQNSQNTMDCHEPNGSRNDELPQNSQDTQNTHPQTPSAREGDFETKGLKMAKNNKKHRKHSGHKGFFS